MSHIIGIDASSAQLSKLRRGHPVRIKKGEGFNLIVHPGTYHRISRAFSKEKGVEIALTPEEIQANRMLSPEEHTKMRDEGKAVAGQGIFGKKFDKLLKKAGIKKAAYRIGDQIKPGVKGLITAGIASGAASLGAAQPELLPFIVPGAASLQSLAMDYIENPEAYQSGIRTRGARSLAGKVAKAKANELINREMGTNYDYMSRAGLEKAASDELTARLSADSIGSRLMFDPYGNPISGSGIGGMHGRRERASIGRGAGMVTSGSWCPPALVSQPFSANFQMQHFLPPQYQAIEGHGLYAGKGLYA